VKIFLKKIKNEIKERIQQQLRNIYRNLYLLNVFFEEDYQCLSLSINDKMGVNENMNFLFIQRDASIHT